MLRLTAYILRNYSRWGRIGNLCRLEEIPSAPTVLDIGAGIGLFATAARYNFPEAVIHCYEPSSKLFSSLRRRAHRVSAVAFQQAIDRQSFREAVDRIGRVGLLKLDCNGAEWQLFEDLEAWKSVNRLAMKYTLLGSTLFDLKEVLKSLGFGQIFIHRDDLKSGMVFAARSVHPNSGL